MMSVNMSKKNCKNENGDQVVPEKFSTETVTDEKPATPRGIVYMSRLPQRFLESDIKRYFKMYGVVTDAKVMRSKLTGMSKKCAYVEFKDAEIAEIVAHLINNATLDVNVQSAFSRISERSVIKAYYISPEKQTSFKEHFHHIDGTGLNLRLEKEFVRRFWTPCYFRGSDLEAIDDETEEEEENTERHSSNDAEDDRPGPVKEENDQEGTGENKANEEPTTSRGPQAGSFASTDDVTNKNEDNLPVANKPNTKKKMVISNELLLALIKALHPTPPNNSADSSSDESDSSDSDDSESDSSDSNDSDSDDSDSDGGSGGGGGDGGGPDGYDTDDDVFEGRKRLRDEEESEHEEEPAPKQAKSEKRNNKRSPA